MDCEGSNAFLPEADIEVFGSYVLNPANAINSGYFSISEKNKITLEYRGFCIFEDDDWRPANLTDFGFWMDFYIGDNHGRDAFTVLVCTPSWFARERGTSVTSGRKVVFMPTSDRNTLDDFLKAECAGESGKGIETTMLKIDGIGQREYRYRS